jgi:hypothetical protein
MLKKENIISTHPAKNMSKNQDPGRANTKMASSVITSPVSRNGMHARISKFDSRKMALSGACICTQMLKHSENYIKCILSRFWCDYNVTNYHVIHIIDKNININSYCSSDITKQTTYLFHLILFHRIFMVFPLIYVP